MLKIWQFYESCNGVAMEVCKPRAKNKEYHTGICQLFWLNLLLRIKDTFIKSELQMTSLSTIWFSRYSLVSKMPEKSLSEYTKVAETSVKTKFKFLSFFFIIFLLSWVSSMFACLTLSESIHNIIPCAIQPPNSSQISALSPLPSLKAAFGHQSPEAYVKCNFISMKVKESFMFHSKYFAKCSNYSTSFLNRSWSGYTLLLICI